MITVEQVVRHQDYKAISVLPHTTIADVARIMTDNQWDMVIVCSDTGQVLGVVSWQDIMRAIAEISGDFSKLNMVNSRVRHSDILMTLLEESDLDKRAALIANLKYL